MAVDATIIAAFHAMWDSFPTRARLIQKDRTVLAVNKAAAAQGNQVGVRCVEEPPKEGHAGCLANQALRERTACYGLTNNKKRLRFWIPVEGCDDVFVHFSIPTEGLFPAEAEM
ncbi:hypothetical protein LJC63_08210 [Ruminococcaceae bacterium OttesenSCG-928-L11]|nr:hypothetical protein [Ruminococcaceae bacterium OttesenSCG-928-L11]